MNSQVLDTEAIREVLRESQRGELIFPEVVRRMLEAGVESYLVDVARAEDVVYLRDGSTLTVNMDMALDPVADNFAELAVVEAIRVAQKDEIRYPEFMRRASAAGVVAYWAFLIGRKVIYFGRKGEFHVEHFPGAK